MEWLSVQIAKATLSAIGYQLQEDIVKQKPLI